MAVVIRLARCGRNKIPAYRVVAADKQFSRDGRFLELLGTYAPSSKSDVKSKLNMVRINHWIKNGAICSDTIKGLVKAQEKVSAQ